MNFNLYVQQNKWVALALMGGAILVLLLALTYAALWKPREEEAEEESRIRIEGVASLFAWLLTFMPWVLVLLFVGSIVYTITHIFSAAVELPNW